MQHVEDMAESERAGALLELSQSLREKADDLLRLVDGSSMVAHKCTPLRNTVRHRQGAAAVERKAAAVVRRAAAIERKAAAVVRRAAAGEQSGRRRAERPQ